MFLKMNHASITADVHICQLGTTPKSPFFPWLCGSLLFETWSEKMWSYVLFLFILWNGNGGKKTSSEVSYRFQSFCVCLMLCSTWRSKQASPIWSMKICLVLTEWICCCEAPRPSRWRIHSHVSTRDCCPSPSATVPGSHLPRACFWSL